jgi:hypothetical protein
LTTVDPAQAVQSGLWELLRSDPEVMQTVMDVLDEMPELNARQYPFVVVPELTSIPDGTHDDPGRRVTARIHTFARGDVRGRNSRPDNTVGARLVALLDHAHKTLDPHVAGHTVWMVRHMESRKVPDADRSVRHRVDRVDIWTSNS